MAGIVGLLLISNIANITFSMCYSTLFESSKLGAYTYFMGILFVFVLYVSFVGKQLKDVSDVISYWTYSLNWFPLFPAVTLMLRYLPLDEKVCYNQFV